MVFYDRRPPPSRPSFRGGDPFATGVKHSTGVTNCRFDFHINTYFVPSSPQPSPFPLRSCPIRRGLYSSLVRSFDVFNIDDPRIIRFFGEIIYVVHFYISNMWGGEALGVVGWGCCGSKVENRFQNHGARSDERRFTLCGEGPRTKKEKKPQQNRRKIERVSPVNGAQI